MKDDSQKIELFIMFNCGSVLITETLEQIEFFISMLETQDKDTQTIQRRTITSSITIFLSNLIEGF